MLSYGIYYIRKLTELVNSAELNNAKIISTAFKMRGNTFTIWQKTTWHNISIFFKIYNRLLFRSVVCMLLETQLHNKRLHKNNELLTYINITAYY